MIKTLEPIDGKETRELLFGYGDLAIMSSIDFSANLDKKPYGIITVIQAERATTPGDKFPVGTTTEKQMDFPITADGVIHLLAFLGRLNKESEDATFTLNFNDGIVKFNFEKFNEKSREVVFNSISNMGAFLTIAEKRSPYTYDDYKKGAGSNID